MWQIRLEGSKYEVKVFDKKGNLIENTGAGKLPTHYTEEQLSEYFSKGIAEKIIKGEGKTKPMLTNEAERKYNINVLSGLDLAVGGQNWMDFYDKEVPKRIRSLIKPYGGKVNEIQLGAGKLNFEETAHFDSESDSLFKGLWKDKTTGWILHKDAGNWKLKMGPVDDINVGGNLMQAFVIADSILDNTGLPVGGGLRLRDELKKATDKGWVRQAVERARKKIAEGSAEQINAPITPKMKEVFGKAQRSFQLEGAKANLEIPNETKFQYILRGVQDKLNRLDQIQRKIHIVNDELDAYMKADLYTSRVTDKIDKLDDYLTDGKDAFFKRLSDDGFSVDDLAEYMYAKHAKERNRHIKKNFNKDNPAGSGMTNKEANAILKKYDKKIVKYAKELRTEIIDKRLDIKGVWFNKRRFL